METIETTSTMTPPSEGPSLFKKRSAKAKSTYRKRPATPPPAPLEDSSSGASSTEDEEGRSVKRRRKHAGVGASSTTASKAQPAGLEAINVTADRSSTIFAIDDATKQSNWFDDNNGAVLNAKRLLGSTRVKPGGTDDAEKSSGTYKGSANYQSFIQKNPNAPTRQVGPVKAPTNVRTITVTDFAPDVCKDYKQTGFCGFGDSCKFLHAREDYKQGWELDRDWEVGTKGKKKLGGQTVASANRSNSKNGGEDDDDDEVDEDAMLENIPFACIICKQSYKNPIVTKCGHYFCENCALQRYRKNPACAACGAGTGGVFNTAKNLRKLLDKKRENARRRREKDREDGLGVSSDADDNDDNEEEDDRHE